MKNFTYHISFFIFLAISLVGCKSPIVEELSVSNLQCEMLENPLGIDSKNPKLSWIINSGQRNISQNAYQILVASSKDILDENMGDLWNSGKVESNQSVHIKYTGANLKSKTHYYWKVKVWSENGESRWSDPSYWSMGLLRYKDWRGRWIGFDRTFPWEEKVKFPTIAARYFRNEFDVKEEKEIKRAMAYIMGLGLYELYINGEKIGDDVLAPSPTDYTKNVKYNTFDVTTSLQSGGNAVGIALGTGRYSAMRPNYKPYKIKDFGFPKVLFCLFIEYTDGSTDVVRTANNWKGTADGPIRANNEYDGEHYDARKEMKGWTKPNFDDKNWIKAEYVQEPRGEFEAQMNENMKVMKTLPAVSIKKMGAQRYIIDMGQNMAGWIQFSAKEKRGLKIVFRYAESLDENNELFTAPLRDAKVTDSYIFKGSDIETWAPKFVYHGFRYVEISGLTKAPKLSDIIGCVVYDNMETTGSFSTSNPLINQIFKNAFWSINGTYKGMPIDCPQRNERMPWLGDRAIGCYGESFVLDNSKLYSKWLDDIRNSQKADGCISDVAPAYFRYYSDNMTWPGTYLFVADMLYQQYGLTEPIVEHYPHMKKWLNYMLNNYLKDHILTKDSYGDWCAPPKTIEEGMGKNANVKHPSALISTAYFYHYLGLMQEFAKIANKKNDIADYKLLAENVKIAFNREFFNNDSAYYGKRKLTENLLALSFGLVSDNKKTELVKTVENIIEKDNNGHLSVGLIGAQWLMRSLSANGLNNLAYKLATNTTYPSWGYMVENGATSIWELWNANTAAPKMNSQNHVMMLGDLIIWYFENLAGIKSDTKDVGFKEIIMNPDFSLDLNEVNASYKTLYGTIQSHWVKTNDSLEWNISIPVNTKAFVTIPGTQESISESKMALKDISGVIEIKNKENSSIIELGSGDYRFKTILK